MAETFDQNLAKDWTTNPNDLLTTDQRTGAVSGIGGPHAFNTTTLFLSSFELAPLSDANPGSTDTSDLEGNTNWNVGDTIYVAGSATTFYQITDIRTPGPELSGTIVTIDGSGQGNTTAGGDSITISGLVDPVVAATVIHKRGDYAGHHGSALRHVRLRNLGII